MTVAYPVLRLAATAAVAAGVLLTGAVPAAAAPVPFSDSSAQGSIGLCSRDGKPLTGGRTSDKPFVVKAVGSDRAPSPYDVSGGKATLYVFQPRQGVPPDEWSSIRLTATSAYTSPAHPSVQGTDLDRSLDDVMQILPPGQDDLMQLRLVYSAPNTGVAQEPYATTVIRVQNGAWSIVQGQSVTCTDGSARSSEVDAGVVNPQGSPIGTAAAGVSRSASAPASVAATPPTAASSDVGPTPASGSSSAVASSTTVAARTATSGRGNTGAVLAVVVPVAVVGFGAASWWWWRQRRRRQADGS